MENKLNEILDGIKTISSQLKTIEEKLLIHTEDRSDDDLYVEAEKAVLKAKTASTSYLQRVLGVGYARASRLMDQLEEKKIIGPSLGAKPRKILPNR